MTRGVYVTGVGIVSPAGCGAEANWRALAGGLRCIERCDDRRITGGAACVGRARGFEPPAGTEDWDRVCQLAAAAADEAVAAADLAGRTAAPADPNRLLVSFGTSKGGILAFARAAEVLGTSHSLPNTLTRSDQRYFWQEALTSRDMSFRGFQNYPDIPANASEYLRRLLIDVPPDAPARRLARRFGAGGAHATVAACATGSLAVIRAIQALLDGDADVVLAGSSDASLHPLWLAAFRQMGVLAEGHPDRGPAWACRPFDRSRSGFVISEGAAAIVLESADSVRRRGSTPLARISGYAMGSDPAGLAQLRPDGAPLAELIKIACARAGLDPAQLAAIQAHGTATQTNDLVEMNAIRRACGAKASEIPVVSFKGALGHLLGAAGSVEIAASVLAVGRQMIPPNSTLIEPDPALGPACLPQEAVSLGPGAILKTAMGFGGHQAAVILDRA